MAENTSRHVRFPPIADVRAQWHHSAMTTAAKKALRLAPFLPALAIAGYIYWSAGSSEPADNLRCRFEAHSTENAPAFGALRKPIVRANLVGHIFDPFEGDLYDFEGTARVETLEETIAAPARGKVFVDDEGQPNGLLITVDSERFGRNGLQISTLNEGGKLDYSTTTVFIYSTPWPGAPSRLAYPAKMDCAANVSE